jgi:hypothetical protein
LEENSILRLWKNYGILLLENPIFGFYWKLHMENYYLKNSYFWILEKYENFIWKTWEYFVKKMVYENGCEIFTKVLSYFWKRHCADLIVKALYLNCEFLSTQMDRALILTCAGLRTYLVYGHLRIVVSFLARCQYLMYKSSLAGNIFSSKGKWRSDMGHPCWVGKL